jgi:hypothetical protein
MSAALKSFNPQLAGMPAPSASIPLEREQTLPSNPPPALKTLPTAMTPLWLTWLRKLRLPATIFSTLLVGSTLPVYGWSVFNQHQWGMSYRELEELQRQERQLASDRAVRRFQVTEASEQQPTGLVPQGPNNTIFLPPAALRAPAKSAQKPGTPTTKTPTPRPTQINPVSY